MLNKKKAFTLIELLAVIIILSLIALISVISVSRSLKNSRNTLTEIQKEKRANYEENNINSIIEILNKSVGLIFIRPSIIRKTIMDCPITEKIMRYLLSTIRFRKISFSKTTYKGLMNGKYFSEFIALSIRFMTLLT